ncbi:MAG: glutamine amidotransferase [Gaiellaceae bacterium MAG52_C11]|nr:glutamine amidotransferase [Candidatus Gaiellasilicea maunaloa]
MKRKRVLLAGETWLSYGIHQKGFSAYTTGSYDDGSREFRAALEQQGWTVEHIPNHAATEDFPSSRQALLEHDVVILSDIGAETLLLHPDTFVRGQRTPNRLREIADWVGAGEGGFLMIGGYMSFSGFEGKARFHGTPIEEVLPIRMLGYDDRAETPEGVTPNITTPGHPILAGLPTEWPHFLGYNRVAPTRGTTLLAFGADPLLIVDSHGKGRVAAFTSDCSPHWGSPEFMDWDGYAPFWDQLLAWLSGRA